MKRLQCDAPIGINVVLSEDLLDPMNEPAKVLLIEQVKNDLRRLSENEDAIREHIETALDRMAEEVKRVRPGLIQRREAAKAGH
jgi:tRNA pseudouridine-54 N-methylase